MEVWQNILVAIYGLFAASGLAIGLKECFKKNPYGLTPVFNLIGAFVWADAVIFGLFWTLVSTTVFFLQDWILFLMTLSVFWLIRSIGETIYWFNQQFAERNRNPFHTLWISKIFPGDSSWVALQIFWQTISVVSAITSLWLGKTWIT